MTVLFFISPSCAPCAEIKDWVINTVQSNGHTLYVYDTTKEDGKQAVATFGVVVTPELIVLDASDKKIAHMKSKAEIQSGLKTALGIKDYTTYYLIGAGVVLVGAMLLMKKKKRGVGRIVSASDRSGRSKCRDKNRSTSTGGGTCSYHGGMNKDFMDREYNFNKSLKKEDRLNGTKKRRKSVTKKKHH